MLPYFAELLVLMGCLKCGQGSRTYIVCRYLGSNIFYGLSHLHPFCLREEGLFVSLWHKDARNPFSSPTHSLCVCSFRFLLGRGAIGSCLCFRPTRVEFFLTYQLDG